MKKLILKNLLYLLLVFMGVSSALAKAPEPYLKSTFEEAANEKKYILLHFYASWCFMCKAQKPILEKLMVNEDKFRKVVTLVVDYDEALKLREDFRKPSQSTFVLLQGNNEIARAARLTQKEDIVEFLNKYIPSE